MTYYSKPPTDLESRFRIPTIVINRVLELAKGRRYELWLIGRFGKIINCLTVMECICADGSAIPPLIVFKGENVSESWITIKELPQGWHVSCNSKGWTSNEHGVQWLKKIFWAGHPRQSGGRVSSANCDGHNRLRSEPSPIRLLWWIFMTKVLYCTLLLQIEN